MTGKGDKKNTVITWVIGNMGGEQVDRKSLTVVYTKKMSCGENSVTGAWSAKGTDHLGAATDNGYTLKQIFERSCM